MALEGVEDAWNITRNLTGTDFPVYRFIPGVSRGEGLFMAILKKEGEWEAGYDLTSLWSRRTALSDSISGIVVKTIERAEHLEVFLRNKHHAALAHQLAQRGIFVGAQGVGVRLVQRVEARDAELRQALVVDKRHVKAARHEGGE